MPRIYESGIKQYIKTHPHLTIQQVAVSMQIPYHLVLEVYQRMHNARVYWDVDGDKESYHFGFIKNTEDEDADAEGEQ